jgi:hypothetical protein
MAIFSKMSAGVERLHLNRLLPLLLGWLTLSIEIIKQIVIQGLFNFLLLALWTINIF